MGLLFVMEFMNVFRLLIRIHGGSSNEGSLHIFFLDYKKKGSHTHLNNSALSGAFDLAIP